MKNKLLTFAGLALMVGALTFHEHEAKAYGSQAGADPDRTGIGDGSDEPFTNEVEVKAIKKSALAGASEALISGLVVMYDQTALDGYTVTRAVTATRAGISSYACTIQEVVATGDTNYHRCITKGYARVRFDGTGDAPIVAGFPVCVNASGVVRGCKLGSALEATANTGIIPLRSNTNTGTDLPVLLNLR